MLQMRSCLHLLNGKVTRITTCTACCTLHPFTPRTVRKPFHHLTGRSWTVAPKNGLFATPIEKSSEIWKKEGNLIQARMLYRKFFKRKSAIQYQKDDNVDSHYELVYCGTVTPYIHLGVGGAGVFVTLICAAALAVPLGVPIVSNYIVSLYSSSMMEIGIFVSFNIILCSYLVKVCRQCALRIYYSSLDDKFIVVFIGNNPFSVQKVVVNPGEARITDPSSMAKNILPWAVDTYSLPTRQVIMYAHTFISPVYYNMMLGY